MEYLFRGTTLSIIQSDIVKRKVDALVNAANAELRGGGGVDGAIHRAGGPAIMAECRSVGYCAPGSAVATTAGALKARYVIHAVGPVYVSNEKSAPTLANAYLSALMRAEERKAKSIAFPAISTGVYGYPIDEAAPIALSSVIRYIEKGTKIEKIEFVLFSERAYKIYEREMNFRFKR